MIALRGFDTSTPDSDRSSASIPAALLRMEDGRRPVHWVMGNAERHTAHPGELQMFAGNFCYPRRYVNRMEYQLLLMFLAPGELHSVRWPAAGRHEWVTTQCAIVNKNAPVRSQRKKVEPEKVGGFCDGLQQRIFPGIARMSNRG